MGYTGEHVIFLTSCWLCAVPVPMESLAPCRTQCRVRRSLKKGNCHLRLCMESTWELRGESEVHHVILVLRDCGAGGRNGSSACQQVTESTRPWQWSELTASLKRPECRLGPEELEGLGGRGSFLLPKVFGNWSGTRGDISMDGKGGTDGFIRVWV